MKKLIYILMVILLAIACEEIYRPSLEDVDDLLVVEAILTYGQQTNNIYLYRTKGFNEVDSTYPRVSGAKVYLSDEKENQFDCVEHTKGVYTVSGMLDENANYRLNIELNGDLYVSETQGIPDAPRVDTVYGERAYNITVHGTANSSETIDKEYGVQLYTDIKNAGGTSHYRFTGTKVLQYTNYFDTVIDGMPVQPRIYIWRTLYPEGVFNISGPPKYSTSQDIQKHSLEFFTNAYNKYFVDSLVFEGWIYIIGQYGLNEDTYAYYEKMNSQLESDGRIFDPIYSQVVGNIRCTTDPSKIVLGNFEISSYGEMRYYVFYDKYREPFRVKKIPYDYNIPNSGYIKMYMPDFWESLYKNYPNE